jgi:prolyl oligopeptidase
MEKKQNVFDDMIAAAEFLHTHGYCSPATTTIQGGSNGGLLVAAAANQRPDLFAAVLGQVGVMDMLRFHKFTIGHAWITDYGNPDKAGDFEFILPYSPLHNVRVPAGGTRQYPAMLLATGDHDDRVVPLHSYKLIAELQHTLAAHSPSNELSPPYQLNPLLIRVDVKSGHGAGKPTDKVIQEAADMLGFAAKCMNAKWKLPAAAAPAIETVAVEDL